MTTSSDDGELIIPGNYATHFMGWWRDIRSAASKANPEFAQFNDKMTALLQQAQYFLLPENGWLLDRGGKLDAKYAPLLHLPFPVTAFEFRADHKAQTRGETYSSKRIALCLDTDIARSSFFRDLADDEWLCFSIFFLDAPGVWGAVPSANIVSRSRTLTVTDAGIEMAMSTLREAFASGDAIDEGNARAEHAGAERLDIRQRDIIDDFSPSAASRFLDTRDELIAAIQACAALSCQNVGTRLIPPSRQLNAKREAAGKLLFNTYHVLDLTHDERGAQVPAGITGSHRSPRQHLRRGHIRRISESKLTWVRSCVVGADDAGRVVKDYQMQRART